MIDIIIANHRITSDNSNIILQKRVTRKRKDSEETYEDWEDVGYYPRMESALTALLDRKLRQSDAKSIEELVQLIRETKREIIEEIRK